MYGIIDLAAVARPLSILEEVSGHTSACLFGDSVHAALKRASPWIVDLRSVAFLRFFWREQGWGKAWGIWIESRGDLHSVWGRLRHFTQARLPSGEGPVLFRFWDPRVFRVYMPLVEPDQLAPWFDGIDAYVAESEDGKSAIRYSLANGTLSQQATVVAPAGG